MKLDYKKLEANLREFYRSPDAAAVWRTFGNRVLLAAVLNLLCVPVGLVLICTIRFAGIGWSIIRDVGKFFVTPDNFEERASVLRRHPERLVPVVGAIVSVDRNGHALVLGTLSRNSQADLGLLARKALEFAEMHRTCHDASELGDMDDLLRDSRFFLDRRRRVPGLYSEGHELLIFCVNIRRHEVFSCKYGCEWVVCLASTHPQGKDGHPRGSVVQIPWSVAASAVDLVSPYQPLQEWRLDNTEHVPKRDPS